jgi:hypothetical protein
MAGCQLLAPTDQRERKKKQTNELAAHVGQEMTSHNAGNINCTQQNANA